MKILYALLIAVSISMPSLSHAGINDPWYLMYKVSGGSIIQTMGPYRSQFECSGARFQLPLGATFIGCAQ